MSGPPPLRAGETTRSHPFARRRPAPSLSTRANEDARSCGRGVCPQGSPRPTGMPGAQRNAARAVEGRPRYAFTSPGQAHPGPRIGVDALLAWPGRLMHGSWVHDRPGQKRCRYIVGASRSQPPTPPCPPPSVRAKRMGVAKGAGESTTCNRFSRNLEAQGVPIY